MTKIPKCEIKIVLFVNIFCQALGFSLMVRYIGNEGNKFELHQV